MAFVHIATPYTMAVVRRQYIVWLKLIWSSLAIIIANPILFLFAFGFGLGRFIDAIGGVTCGQHRLVQQLHLRLR